ncbi:MAG: TonB-dependent receptor [Acidobacteriota bacterium]|nr:TonB-dependent receptor [Acidobacteriota bacterium]
MNLRVVLCLLILATSTAFAQFDTASVIGTVRDQTGAVVNNSKVTLQSVDTGVNNNTNTDANGDFTFLNVRVGKYTLRAEAPGFKAAVASEFTVTVSARQRVDLNLQLGATTETVDVQGGAVLLETDSSDRGTVINTQAIVNLPLNGRSYADLTLLSPGVRKSALENQTATNRDASFNVNGQRSALNNFMVDGVDNNAYGTSNQGFSNQVTQLTPDAVAEFRVETDNYSAEYGRAAGAVINVTTRSGTNSLHGAMWEYLRNTSLNAVGFFKPIGGVKPPFIQNQFGAAAGGPIRKDKMFIFGDYEGFRRITRSLSFATVPTADQKAGNFGTPIRNALTGEVYANGVLPASQVTPFARALMDALPLPNLPELSNNYSSLPRSTIGDNKGDVRFDYYATSKITSFFRYSQREEDILVAPAIPLPGGGDSNGNVRIKNRQIEPGVTYTLSSSSVIEGRLGLSWTEGGKFPLAAGTPSLLTPNGIGGLPTDPLIAGGVNSQGVGGFSQFGRQTSNPQFQNPYNLNPKINYSKFIGRHSLKAGYEHQHLETAIDDFNPVYGLDTYGGQFSRPAGANQASAANLVEAYNLADFLVGARSSYELNNFAIVNQKQRMHFGYVQDDWKVSTKLTLNIGLRYEFATPQWVDNYKLANFDPGTNSLIFAKAGSIYDRSLVNPRYDNWAPRFGLAYRLTSKTVIRSAYGISYVQFNRLGGENLLAYNGPNIVDAQITQDPTKLPICGPNDSPTTCFRPTQQGYPANFASPDRFNTATAQVRYIPKDNPTGYVQSWHFTVQHELARNLLLDVGYVGNKGTHLMTLADWNQARPNAIGENTSLQARRPIPNFTYIEVAEGIGFSSYNALQAKLEKRYSAGLYLLDSFTWSKAIDNASGHLETANGDNSRVNLRDLRNEKGLSGYDQPFNNTTSLIYEFPYGHGRRWGSSANGFVQAILGGWQMTMINTATSGLPINLTYNPISQFQVSTAPNFRPNISGDPVTPEGQRTIKTYLNRATVSIPTDPSHPFGNAGRNIARSHSFEQVDLGLHKQFRLWSEASKLDFRTEAFNLTNQTNFQAADGNISNGSFGSITSTYPARQIQFALKVIF